MQFLSVILLILLIIFIFFEVKYTGRNYYNTSFFDTGEQDADGGTNFVVGNLVPGTLYNFKVNGISVCGEGQPNTVDATTKMAGKQYQSQFS